MLNKSFGWLFYKSHNFIIFLNDHLGANTQLPMNWLQILCVLPLETRVTCQCGLFVLGLLPTRQRASVGKGLIRHEKEHSLMTAKHILLKSPSVCVNNSELAMWKLSLAILHQNLWRVKYFYFSNLTEVFLALTIIWLANGVDGKAQRVPPPGKQLLRKEPLWL